MLMRLFSPRWLPVWMRRDHPIVHHHLRKPLMGGVNRVVFGTTFLLFLGFGGLSLPMLYLLFSLIVLVQVSAGTAGKIHSQRERRTWDLMRVAPYSPREVLLSAWAASLWQIDRTWLMPFYRLMQGVVIIGLMVFGLWFGNIPSHLSLLVLVAGTLLIALQPIVDMYFGGMVGLLTANLISGRMGAQVTAGGVALVYWSAWIGITSAVAFSDLNQLTAAQVTTVVALCLLLPVILGYVAFRVAVATIR